MLKLLDWNLTITDYELEYQEFMLSRQIYFPVLLSEPEPPGCAMTREISSDSQTTCGSMVSDWESSSDCSSIGEHADDEVNSPTKASTSLYDHKMTDDYAAFEPTSTLIEGFKLARKNLLMVGRIGQSLTTIQLD